MHQPEMELRGDLFGVARGQPGVSSTPCPLIAKAGYSDTRARSPRRSTPSRGSAAQGLIMFGLEVMVLMLASTAAQEYYDNYTTSACTGDSYWIGDGFCDTSLNTPECWYDGGDCCECDCVDSDYKCGSAGFDCQDPESDSVFFQCGGVSTVDTPCPTGPGTRVVVESTASAWALAEAVRCSGGAFHVEWCSSVVINQTIYVANGTSLNVSCADSGGVVDGGLSTQLFLVDNASLHVNNVRLERGFSLMGGAIAASGSNVHLNGAYFASNKANYSGGALYVTSGSAVVSDGPVEFWGNTAGSTAGAVYVGSQSTCDWRAETSFANNIAGSDGGALYLTLDSTAIWEARVSFEDNSARGYGHGGALMVLSGSRASWIAEASFVGNDADSSGGALAVLYASSVSWVAETSFANNAAGSSGGAITVYGNSSVYWEAATSFDNNTGFSGGALIVLSNATAFWDGVTHFVNNSASHLGGAVAVYDASTASWDARSVFQSNVAGESGGALFVSSSSNVSWISSFFSSNNAKADGGAVLIEDGYGQTSPSRLTIDGTTSFVRNNCGGNGGALAVTMTASVSFGTEGVAFVDNRADVNGGALYMSELSRGPHLMGLTFDSNKAEFGGAVYSTSCGTDRTLNKDGSVSEMFPVTIDRCQFNDNQASGSGGAVSSRAGQDYVGNTSFRGNTAGVGGAMQLTGTVHLQNCTFLDNTSAEGEGAAISNVGTISVNAGNDFFDNAYECLNRSFLDYDDTSTAEEVFEVVCKGCDTLSDCGNCSVVGQFPSCTGELEHTSSPGGGTSLEMLVIHRGYWRATNTSRKILRCHYPPACLGGVTGSDKYCQKGYRGPYCSVCGGEYTRSAGFVCEKCPDGVAGIAVTVTIAVLALPLVAAIIWYLVSTESVDVVNGKGLGMVRYRGSRLLAIKDKISGWRLESLKIVIIVWQILAQFASAANVAYPGVYGRFVNVVTTLNFDVGLMIPTGCIMRVTFHDRLLVSTIGPLVCVAILGVTFTIARWRYRGSPENLENARRKHLSMGLLLTFFVYSSVSSTLFQAFMDDELDDGKTYLRADYRIEFDSLKHRLLLGYSSLMLLLYTVGIPALYAKLLFDQRKVLTNEFAREHSPAAQLTSNLWELYKPTRFYYELIECVRRIMLTGIVVFIYPDTAAQVAVVLLMAAFFMVLCEVLSPYASEWDAWISRTGHAIVFTSIYLALLQKVDVSTEEKGSQEIFGKVLVAIHMIMVSIVVIKAAIVSGHLLKADTAEDSYPRPRCSIAATIPLDEDDSVEPYVVDQREMERSSEKAGGIHCR